MESEPCFFCLFIFGLLILFFCGRGLYSDYSFNKNKNWNFEDINPKTIFLFKGFKTKKEFHGSESFFLKVLIGFVGLVFIFASFFV